MKERYQQFKQIRKHKYTFTTAGSHTKLAKESVIPPVFISTPKFAPSPVINMA